MGGRRDTGERSERGATIAEFALTLIALLLLIFLPCANAVLFWSAYFSLDNINREAVESVAMSDTLELAVQRSHELLSRYTNPLLTMYQSVQLDSGSASHLMIVVNRRDGACESYDAERGLPRDKRPDYRDNRSRFSYSFRLQEKCVIRPFFNLSSIPLIGQTGIVGRATPVTLRAMAPIENLDSLNNGDKPASVNQ